MFGRLGLASTFVIEIMGGRAPDFVSLVGAFLASGIVALLGMSEQGGGDSAQSRLFALWYLVL